MDKYIELEEEDLSIVTVQELYNNNTFEYCLIQNRITGKTRENLKLNFCKINADISNNIVNDLAEFNNCCFEEMKIINNRAKKIIFRNCMFDSVVITKNYVSEIYFENCSDTAEISFVENTVNLLTSNNSDIEEDNFNNYKNKISKINFINTLENEKNEKQSVALNNEEEEETMNIITHKEFENVTLTLDDLNNKTFNRCQFFRCKFDESINLKANTDFISCRFDNCEFSEGKYDKVAFDESEFYNTIFKGDFIRCTFCKCIFFESSVKRTAHFFMCNFDNSNAAEQFADCLEQFTEIDFGKNHFVTEKEENDNANIQINNTELLELLKPVYDYLKEEDSDLKDELEKAKNSVNKNSVEKFLLDCDDKEFMLILSNVSMNRSLKYQNKNINGSIESDNII